MDDPSERAPGPSLKEIETELASAARKPPRPIPESALDPDALKVLRRLQRYRHAAYFVGGCVRDILLGISPKDYDIGTSARPRQVKQLFRNSRVIGRRFRLVHIVFGSKVIEVATFRSQGDVAVDSEFDEVEENEGKPPSEARAEDLLIRSDNVYGTPREDAFRRDFTVNGLIYDSERGEVVDFVGGLPDVEKRLIRTIGDPDVRFQEDPVRILRAIKFAARLGFGIDPPTYDAMVRHRRELAKAAPPRIAEELARLLAGGAAEESFRLMEAVGVIDQVLPWVADALRGLDPRDFWGRLRALDSIEDAAKKFSRVTMLALIYSPIFERIAGSATQANGRDPGVGFTDAMRPLLAGRLLSRREADRMKQIFLSQRRLMAEPDRGGARRGRRRRMPPKALATREYFREALAFFKLDCMARGVGPDAWERWDALLDQAPPTEDVSRWARRDEEALARVGGEDESAGDDAESGAGGEGDVRATPAPRPVAVAAPAPPPKPPPLIMPLGGPVINPYTGRTYTPRKLVRQQTEAALAAMAAAGPVTGSAQAVTPTPNQAPSSSAPRDAEPAASPSDQAPREGGDRDPGRRRRRSRGRRGGRGRREREQAARGEGAAPTQSGAVAQPATEPSSSD